MALPERPLLGHPIPFATISKVERPDCGRDDAGPRTASRLGQLIDSEVTAFAMESHAHLFRIPAARSEWSIGDERFIAGFDYRFGEIFRGAENAALHSREFSESANAKE